ncbi:hypothetical protein KY285_029031 [Solanum tuberosum]|nr:hypothetical protein KY285_029031 [Solanum tuberosum]
MVYGDFESSFKALPRYMAALQFFNPDTIIEWEHHSTTMQVVGRSFPSTADIFMLHVRVLSLGRGFSSYYGHMLFVNDNELEKLTWLAATEHQKKKFVQQMQQIKILSPASYGWLNEFPLEKWTMYKDGDRRWGAMTTNVSESYNSLLKKARGQPVTAMV